TDVAAEERVLYGQQPHSPGQLVEQRLEHRRPQLSRHDHIPPLRLGSLRRKLSQLLGGIPTSYGQKVSQLLGGIVAGGAVAGGGSAVDPGEETRPRARAGKVVTGERGPDLGLERAGHADAVLVLGASVGRID